MDNDIPHTPRSANPYAIQSFDQLRVIYPDVENALPEEVHLEDIAHALALEDDYTKLSGESSTTDQ